MRLHFLNIAGAVALLLSSASAPPEFLKPPPSAKSEKGTTTTSLKEGGRLRWKSEWTMEREVGEGPSTVRFSEKGSGRYSGFNQEVRWNIETMWTSGEAFRPLSSERTVTDVAGKLLLRERKSFNFDKRTVDLEKEDSTGQISRRSLSIPADTLAVDGIAGALRSLPFERSRPVELHLLSNEPKLYDVSFEVRGRERVRTPAGQFECYKVEIHPGLGVLKLFGFLVPNAYFWFTVDEPHYWVRYEGPENGRGTPQVIMELATFERSN